jgi:hypothetical protein
MVKTLRDFPEVDDLDEAIQVASRHPTARDGQIACGLARPETSSPGTQNYQGRFAARSQPRAVATPAPPRGSCANVVTRMRA